MSSKFKKSQKTPQKVHTPSRNLLDLERVIKSKFIKKYYNDDIAYLKTIINNIIYNEKSNIVAIFKDYLILDDLSEFLKRFYTNKESNVRLPKFCEYYETYSKIYPNYTSLIEGKYIYSNIQKKQRMIDLQEKKELEDKLNKKLKKKTTHTEKEKEIVFSTEIYNSIINDRNNEDFEILFGIENLCTETNEEQFNKNIKGIIDDIDKYEREEIIISEKNSEGELSPIQTNKFLTIQNVIDNRRLLKSNYNLIFNPNVKGFITEKYIKEKIEHNLFKTKRILNNQRRNKVRNDIQFLYSKNGIFNNNSNQNLPLTCRENSNSLQSNENQRTPSIDLSYYNKYFHNSQMHQKLNNSRNKFKISTTSKKFYNKSNLSHNHHNSLQTSNITYILNKNSNFTTQVNAYNNNNYQGTKVPYNLSFKQMINSNASHSNSRKKIYLPYSSTPQNVFSLKQQLLTTNTINKYQKKRTLSDNINSNNNLGEYQNLYRINNGDFGNKEVNLLRNNGQNLNQTQLKENLAKIIQRGGLNGEILTGRNNYYRDSSHNVQVSRNERQEKNFGSNLSGSGSGTVNNYVKRNESMNKIKLIEENIFRDKIKGIKIKEFNKIFSKNGSNYQNKTERLKNN